MPFQAHRYKPAPVVPMEDRLWPDRVLDRAPRFCSVDLRDGNQALATPMGIDRKLRFFDALVAIGFKEIEVGFPSASATEFDFLRALIDGKRIPADVTIQVLTQARESLIRRTFEALTGAPRASVHVYNSTSTLQRRVVFGKDRSAIRDLAVAGTRWVREGAANHQAGEIILEYSPESFSGTEPDFALEVCEAVVAEWNPTPARKVILNLPATVEMTTPNVYADQVEWMHRRLSRRDSIVLSVHAHNDRGCAIAASELAMLAGADRVEGTLFGNGERTGNTDLVAVAMNLYSQGIDPGLDLSDIPALVRVYEECNQLPVPARHPYAGELVFTAFSGSHQDAIRKGLDAMEREKSPCWEVPYLPIDPGDIGRKYEPLIRINSQSGKGGVAYVLHTVHGYVLPKDLVADFGGVIQGITDKSGKELSSAEILAAFESAYMTSIDGDLGEVHVDHPAGGACGIRADVRIAGCAHSIAGKGTGPIDAFTSALSQALRREIQLCHYSEHARGGGAGAEAVAYVGLVDSPGNPRFGVGRDRDIVSASFKAVLAAVHGGERGAKQYTDA